MKKKNKALLFGLCTCVYSVNDSREHSPGWRSQYYQEMIHQIAVDEDLFSKFKNLKWNTDKEKILDITGSAIGRIVSRSDMVLSRVEQENILSEIEQENLSIYLKVQNALWCELRRFNQVPENERSAVKARLTCAFLFMRLAICTDDQIKEFYKDLLTQMFNENVFLYDAPTCCPGLLIGECEDWYKRFTPEIDLNKEAYRKHRENVGKRFVELALDMISRGVFESERLRNQFSSLIASTQYFFSFNQMLQLLDPNNSILPEDYYCEFKGRLIPLDDVRRMVCGTKTLDEVLSQAQEANP